MTSTSTIATLFLAVNAMAVPASAQDSRAAEIAAQQAEKRVGSGACVVGHPRARVLPPYRSRVEAGGV